MPEPRPIPSTPQHDALVDDAHRAFNAIAAAQINAIAEKLDVGSCHASSMVLGALLLSVADGVSTQASMYGIQDSAERRSRLVKAMQDAVHAAQREIFAIRDGSAN